MMTSNRSIRMFVLGAALLAACGGKKPVVEASLPPINIANDNIAIADSATVERGPSLSGTLAPEHSAQLRSQTNGSIIAMNVESGASVAAGQIVAVIDTFPLAESARSARSQFTSSQLNADLARRNHERMTTLHGAGAISDRDLELAHNQTVAADAALADAKNRLTSIEHQLSDAIVRAPFAGVVSERPANAGDVLQMGSPLMTIVDPTLLQLEASVPADQLAAVKTGAKVEFNVTGFAGRRFTGKVARISPTVDATTRQVRLFVTVPNGDRTIVAGAFAEGRVAVTSTRALTVPLTALDARAAVVSVKRLKNGKVESVPVTLGVRDDVAERVEITKGLQAGDSVLVGGALGTPVGAVVRPAHADH